MLFKQSSVPIVDLDEPSGIITAYANVYHNEDSDEDISMPGCFTKAVSEGMKRLRVLKDHNSRESLGVPLTVDTQDPYGLKTVTQFNMKKDLSKDMYSDIVLAKNNDQNAELSIGYGNVIRDPKDQRKIIEYQWLGEYSFLSSWAANPLAIVTDVKSMTPEKYIDLLVKMYNLPHSDARLIQVENILKSLTKEPSDTLDTLDVKPMGLFNLVSKKQLIKPQFTINI